MAGKHSAPGQGRLYREILRFALIFFAIAAVGIIGLIWISNTLEGGDAIPVEATQETNTTTSVLSETITTPSTTSSTTTTTVATTTTTIPTTTTTTLPPLVEPAEITVIVLNSTTTQGMAARLTSQIADLGYQTIEADNYRPALDVSRIWYIEGLEREAQLLLEAIPDAIVELNPTDPPQSDITVVLGASFSE